MLCHLPEGETSEPEALQLAPVFRQMADWHSFRALALLALQQEYRCELVHEQS